MTQPNSKLKQSLLALMATVSISGFSLGLTAQANNTSSSYRQSTLAQAANSTQLKAIGMSGLPNGLTEQEWMNASGKVMITDVNEESYTIKVEANGLVPHGLYTVWWMKEEGGANQAGPAGGLPYNDVRADRNGNLATVIKVPTNNDYEMMAMAYHSDDQTHGSSPGENGVNSFGHLMGQFIKPSN